MGNGCDVGHWRVYSSLVAAATITMEMDGVRDDVRYKKILWPPSLVMSVM